MNRRAVLRAIPASGAVLVAGCSSSGEQSDPVVAVSETGYEPRQLSVAVGETVTWVNENRTLAPEHTVTSRNIHDDATSWDFDERLEEEGDEVSHTFEAGGIYTYVGTVKGEDCMCGAIVVGDATLDDPLPCHPVRGGGC